MSGCSPGTGCTRRGYLLGPTEARRRWTLPEPVAVTVTDRRIAYAGGGPQLALVDGVGDGARHRRGVRLPGLISGQIRWQWPSRLELLAAGPGEHARLLVVCDALRTIQQPALGLTGPAGEITGLTRQVRRAVAGFRLAHPELVDLSPPERDVLAVRAGAGPGAGETRITLPGSLPVEFHSRDDYYRPGPLRSRVARARSRRSIRASVKPTARAAASTVAPWPMRCSARSTRSSCW